MSARQEIIENSIEEEEPIPSWLDESYIENALQTYRKDRTLRVTKMKITPASKKGDSYASVMFRIRMNYLTSENHTEVSDSIILKMSFEENEMAEEIFVRQFNVYEREIKLYDQIFPKMKAMLRKAGDLEVIIPEMIYADYDRMVIIFEDLALKSFEMADRLCGLDLTHAKLVLRKLAKLHASSAVLNERIPGILESYDRGMLNRHTSIFAPFYQNGLEVCGQLTKEWDGFQVYGEKLIKLKSKVMEYGIQSFTPTPSYLNVLCHGDIWVNNAMFTYSERREPIDTIILDFQYCCWSSPAIDLHYFLNTSLREELRLHHLDELVQFYYYNLSDTLRALEYKKPIPSLKDFWVQYTDKSFYALISSIIVQPVQTNENTDDADFAAILGEDERSWKYRRSIYSSEKSQKNLKRLLPILDRRGLLDVD